jgi:hypothetical protein
MVETTTQGDITMNALAERFRKLPFAFLQEPEIETLAKEIEAGKLGNVIATLEQDIQTHEHCDNWIKAEHEGKVLNDLLEVWDGRS